MDYSGKLHRADATQVQIYFPTIIVAAAWVIVILVALFVLLVIVAAILAIFKPKDSDHAAQRLQCQSDMLALARRDLDVSKRVLSACESSLADILEADSEFPAVLANFPNDDKRASMRMEQRAHLQDLIQLCRGLVEDLAGLLAEATPESFQLDEPMVPGFYFKQRIVRTGDMLRAHLILLQGECSRARS